MHGSHSSSTERRARGRIAAMVLAAGRGERMRPLTDATPKALLTVLGVPMLELIVEKLRRSGLAEIHCNLHHRGEEIERLAAARAWEIAFHREGELLGTGGGIGNMARSLAADVAAVFLHNGDILSNLAIAGAIDSHGRSGALVTMVLAASGPRRNVVCARDGAVLRVSAGEERDTPQFLALGYTGLAVLSREALERFPARRANFVDVLHGIIESRPGSVRWMRGDLADASFRWGEIGSPGGYLDIHRRVLVGGETFDPLVPPPPLPLHVAEGARVAPDVSWGGFLEVGALATIGAQARLEECVVLAGATVPPLARMRRAIIGKNAAIEAPEQP